MNLKIVYFTRTGTSKRVAEKITKLLSCGIVQIEDNINWKGFFGYLKAGFYSSTNRNVAIEINGILKNTEE